MKKNSAKDKMKKFFEGMLYTEHKEKVDESLHLIFKEGEKRGFKQGYNARLKEEGYDPKKSPRLFL